jgi:hypothetical protein
MQESKQSVEEVKHYVQEARHKAAPRHAPAANGAAAYNEEDFMDGDLVDEDMH